MIDEKRIKRFIEGAKEAFKEVDDPTFTFPMNILSAYELATSIEELLKAQEPRVMTPEEAISDYIGVAYYESIYSSIVLAGYMVSVRNGRCEFATIGSEETEKDMLSDYGIKWRCWTSPPTEEQRKATLWKS